MSTHALNESIHADTCTAASAHVRGAGRIHVGAGVVGMNVDCDVVVVVVVVVVVDVEDDDVSFFSSSIDSISCNTSPNMREVTSLTDGET